MKKRQKIFSNKEILTLLADEKYTWKPTEHANLFRHEENQTIVKIWLASEKTLCFEFQSPEIYGRGFVDEWDVEDNTEAKKLFNEIKQKAAQQ